MMRAIKFRVWNDESRTMSYINITNKNSGCGWIQSPHTVFMEFTGLKDKNGVEIYEGDIITGTDLTPDRWGGPQRWGNPKIIKRDDIATGFTPLNDRSGCDSSSVEVIGNINENTDLV